MKRLHLYIPTSVLVASIMEITILLDAGEPDPDGSLRDTIDISRAEIRQRFEDRRNGIPETEERRRINDG